MHLGKQIRLERILNRDTRRAIIVPLDHGVTVGPLSGLTDMRQTLSQIATGGANAVVMHKGLVRCGHRGSGPDIGLIIHLSASTSLSPFPNAKTLVASVEEALRLGADGVSVHVNLGDENEREMLEDMGRVSAAAASWGMPMLAMMYARGPKVPNEYDPEVVAHCARVGVELGADLVKVPYTGDMDSFQRVVDACCVPVVIAGGPKMNSVRDVLQVVSDSIKAGGAGLSIGRNIFQAEKPKSLLRAMHGIVHDDLSVDQAMEVLARDG
ncbi:2-amino-3,7-dideoxy-D-threo-hept-6-ulosonate synthase [Desulfonatronum sp. SC1]|uniref:2-amino-3,7-dideoxy-D-threo-hept-6-ulosonate synthase n=1 Tax=Desulfonatronum sp. SC1 TaxID=2109626 RepID=UPI000D3267D2|nr:2-amino-3,7-dideoxy-D-threo-hept-6-ulosonate synthase [Desulfonatronum sp. SC1]PTN37181.1 fructose-bisphosphate aldolase [Desulfonatronum sp. SC1]